MVSGHENKINQAYSDGGERLSDRVIGEFVGLPAAAGPFLFSTGDPDGKLGALSRVPAPEISKPKQPMILS